MKTHPGKLLLIFCTFFVSLNSVYATTVPIDFNTWQQKGNTSSGNWKISSDGTSVTQTLNSGPTFFVSQEESLNKTFSGSFSVNDNDDDFIGFVFGFSEPDNDLNQYDFILFDWKKAAQAEKNTSNIAQEGFTLTRVQGFVEDINPDTTGNNGFWSHTHSSMTVLDSSYGNDLGWKNKTIYEFNLTYLNDRITIKIDGETIFDISGNSYPSGYFGFYNFSQPNVTYQSFTQIPEPASISLIFLGLSGLFLKRRLRKTHR